MRPDFILKLESVESDLREYLKLAGIKGDYAEKFPWSNPNQGEKASYRTLEYYSRLNKSTVQELFYAYKTDHDLFGYNPKLYLDIPEY